MSTAAVQADRRSVVNLDNDPDYHRGPEQDQDGALAHKVGGMTLDERLANEDNQPNGYGQGMSAEEREHQQHEQNLLQQSQSRRTSLRPKSVTQHSHYSTNEYAAPLNPVDARSVRDEPVNNYPRSNADAMSTRKSFRGTDAGSIRAPTHNEGYESQDRPEYHQQPSRSYAKPIPIVTTYEPESEPMMQRRSSKAGSIKRPASRTGSVRHSIINQPNGHNRNVSDTSNTGAAAPGEIMSPERQRDLQAPIVSPARGVSLQDNGTLGARDRSTTFDEASSHRPRSAFGSRPEPVLTAVSEDQRESQYGTGRDSRAGVLNRNGTVLSRAGTMGRNGTLSRGANGGTVGSRRGAFGRGAGTTIGTQPEEVLGRDDIHTRAELSERILDETTLRRLATMEKKDAKRLSKVIKAEGKAEAKSVLSSIKELERLVKLQREAARAERKSQMRLGKWTNKEHKARLRFLKEKERYERIEGELRNAENDFEERRDHAAGLTGQVAEKTQDLDDLRGQKAADDREREVKLLALRNPAHS